MNMNKNEQMLTNIEQLVPHMTKYEKYEQI